MASQIIYPVRFAIGYNLEHCQGIFPDDALLSFVSAIVVLGISTIVPYVLID